MFVVVRAALVVQVLVLAFAAGCSSDQASGGAAADAKDLSRVEMEAITLEPLRSDVLADCMRAEGFDYFDGSSPEVQEQTESSDVRSSFSSYLPIVVEGRSTYRWLVAPETVPLVDDKAPASPNAEYYDQLDSVEKKAYDEARFGAASGNGGCEKIADEESGINDVVGQLDSSRELASQAFERLVAAGELDRIVLAWSGCMSDSGLVAGLTFSDPMELGVRLEDEFYVSTDELGLGADPGLVSELVERQEQVASAVESCGATDVAQQITQALDEEIDRLAEENGL